MRATSTWRAYGELLRSDIDLPLSPAEPADDEEHALEVALGEPRSSTLGHHGWRAHEDGVDLDLPGVGWSRLRGRQAIVHASSTTDAIILGQAVATTLLTGWAIVRGAAVVLHAAHVQHEGAGVAICAPSGGGKSTLAAAAAGRGSLVFGDDACHLDPTALTRVRTRGAVSLRIARDSARALALDPTSLPRAVGDRRQKVVLDLPSDPDATPAPLRGIAFLRRVPGASVATPRAVAGAHALTRLVDVVYRPRLTRYAQGEQRPFEVGAELATRVQTVELLVPDQLDAVHDAADVLLDWTRTLA